MPKALLTSTEEDGTVSTPTKRHKNASGHGSIYFRESDKKWVGTIMLGRRADGRPERPKVTGETKKEVTKKLAELKLQAEEGTRVEPSKSRQTVAEYLNTWLAAARTSTRPRTWERYAQVVRLHIVPALGHLKLTTLRPDAVQKLYGDKLAEGLSPGTIAKIHVVLHRALHMAEKWGYIVRNPADNVDKPNAPRPQVHPPDPADLIKLINTAVDAGDHLAPLWTLAVYSGCRAGELLGLGWQDVDFERGMITIRRTLVRTSQLTPQFGEPKSATSRRTVTLPAFAVNALRALKAREDQERASALDWADNGLVFCSHVGTPLLARNVIRDYKKALKRAGLPETIRFHDLRHAHATVLLRAGVPLKVASGRLGHSSIGITANLYQHLASDMDRDAAERIAQVLQP